MRASDPSAAAWQATAAYLYLLRLDAASLAWEYLRRAPEYRAAWHRLGRQAPPDVARPWGLMQLEDPDLDARFAHPVWDERMPTLLHVHAQVSEDQADRATEQSLNLWHLPGAKHLAALPAGGYALQVREENHTLRARLGLGVLEGLPALCIVPLDARLHAQAAVLTEHATRFAPRRAVTQHRTTRNHGHVHPVTLASLHHLHALQALDGARAGASHRRIAEVLYGVERVHRQWHADSALRAQVRHSLARGATLMRGGYRRLVGLTEQAPARVGPPGAR